MFKDFTYKEDGDKVHVSGFCIVTKKPVKMAVTLKEFNAYYFENALIQDAFPTLSCAEREYFVSGVSPGGWKKLFGKDK